MKITTRLIVILFIMIYLPVVIFGGVAYYFGSKSLVDFVQARVVGVNEAKAKSINTFYQELQPIIKPFATVPGMQEALTTVANLQNDAGQRALAASGITNALNRQYTGEPLLNAYVLRSDTTVVYTYASSESAVTGELVSDGLSQLAKESQTSESVADVVRGPNGTMLFMLGQPIVDSQNFPVGVILFQYDFDTIVKEVATSTGLAETGETFIGRYEDATTALYLSPLRYDTEAALTRRAVVKAKHQGIVEATHGETGAGLTIDYREEPVLAAWSPLTIPGWGIVTKLDQSEALGSLALVKKSLAILYFALAVVLALGIWLVVHRMVSRPLRSIATVAGLIEQERFSEAKVNRKMIYSHDEFGAVANALHHIIEHHQYEHPPENEGHRRSR